MKALFHYTLLSIMTVLFAVNLAMAQPANNDCASATVLTVGASCVTTAGTTALATQSIPPITCATFTAASALDVWYQFVANAAILNVTVVGDVNFDPVVDVRSGACDGVNIACADATTAGGTEVAALTGLTIGNTYLVRVYDYIGTATFTICVAPPPPPPANDNCAGAIAFPTIPTNGTCASLTGNTASATQSQAACTGSGADDDVWFSFVAPATTVITELTAISGNTDRVHQVFSGTCGSLVSLTCSDPETSTTSGLTVGTTYYVRVHTYSAATSTEFNICLKTPPPPPANDDCVNATTLTVNPDLNCGMVTPGTVAGATGAADATCSGTEDDDVWFKFTATSTSHKIDLLNVTGSVTDMAHQVLSACGGTNLLCSDPNSSTVTGLTIGNVYFLRVYTFTSTTGQNTTFNVCIGTPPPPPSNDNCSAAIPLTVNADFNCGATTNGTTVSATQSTETAPSCSATGVNDDVWYSFTASGTAHQVLITGASTTTAIAVYSGSCGALTQISGACASTSSGTATINLTGLTAGTTYIVRVYTTSTVVGTSATFTMCVGTPPPPPANDNCAGAIAFPTILNNSTCAIVTATTVSATGSADATCTGTEDDDVWYTFTTPAGVTSLAYVNTNISGSTDRVLQIYSGTCAGLTSIGCYDPESGIITGLTGSTTYFLRAYTFSSAVSSTFTICLRTLPANDACANAVLISGCQTVSGTTIGATGDALTASCNAISVTATSQGVWYRFVGDGNPVEVNTCSPATNFDTKIHVYSGSCGALTCVGGNDDDTDAACLLNGLSRKSKVTWVSTIGVTYFIYVYPFTNPGGDFELNLISGPPCLSPAPVTGSIGTTSASISWSAMAGAVNYTYSYGSGAHTCGTGAVSQAGTSVNLTGLIPNTTYTFCVRTNCSCGSSSYASIMFTTDPLPNDACAGAQTISCGSTINGSTVGAVSDAAVGSCGVGTGGTPGNGVWYKLVGNGGQVTASLCGSAYNTKLHVYTGSCAGLTCLVSNDDNAAACGGGSTRSQVVFNANVGTDYYILVSGVGSTTGAFSLNLTCLCGPALGAPWTVTNIGASNGGAIENVCDGTIDVKATNIGSPSNDILTYAWQQLCGNGFIQAKVENVINGGWGGIMFRENNAGGSKKVALRTQLNNNVIRDIRSTTNGFSQQQSQFRPNAMWLRLTRTGNAFVGETSVNGVNWDLSFTVTLVLPSCIEVGLFSQSINVNTTTTAVFSNVTGVPTSPPVIPLVDGNNNDVVETQAVLSLFPNPATDEINVKMEAFYGKNVTISVQNQLGQVMLQRDIDDVQDATERIELTNLPSGIYTLTLRTAGQAPMSKQFMVGQIRP